MKVVLYTNCEFLINEISKIKNFEIDFIHEFNEIYNYKFENSLFLYHLDSDDNLQKHINLLYENLKHLKTIAIRNNTNNIEGCLLLKKGFKGYMHSLSNFKILNEAIESIKDNKIWIYPELMQFLISSVPVKSENNDLLKLISTKELEVLELVAQGLNNNEIAEIMSVAEITVKKHISSLFKKLNQKDRLSLALYYKNHSK